MSEPRAHHAVVGHRGGDETDHAAGGGDIAVVDDLGVGIARLVEGRLARKDVRVRGVRGGGEKRADIHFGIWPEQDAVAVDQNDFAVGQQIAENLRRVRAADTVDGC